MKKTATKIEKTTEKKTSMKMLKKTMKMIATLDLQVYL